MDVHCGAISGMGSMGLDYRWVRYMVLIISCFLVTCDWCVACFTSWLEKIIAGLAVCLSIAEHKLLKIEPYIFNI